ncbi:MAG: hypothetical protein R3D98_16850 [Candidatus Krumholzibacteriia bacterium]
MVNQTTLLVSHKGVDLHAATAVRVMQRRLEGGEALRSLARCEVHLLDGDGGGRCIADLLRIGRYFNPNKHHYGHFAGVLPEPWTDEMVTGGAELPAGWPGEPVATDLPTLEPTLATALLGGPVPDGCVAVDVVALPLGEVEPVRSGVLWRLVLDADGRDPARLGERLAVARGGSQGLLINPHLHGWLLRVRRP